MHDHYPAKLRMSLQVCQLLSVLFLVVLPCAVPCYCPQAMILFSQQLKLGAS